MTFHFEKMYRSVGVLKRAVVLQCEQLEVLGLTRGSSPGLGDVGGIYKSIQPSMHKKRCCCEEYLGSELFKSVVASQL